MAKHRQRPGDKPQMTPWHPELGRRRAIALLIFYLSIYGLGFALLAVMAAHGRF